ncbi:YycH family regulatory protein [Cytobacillus sp. IB215665]|uniref:YycH family regulatory protein n=1 Tax=Cytobacillus sp. IB215665 TaxID=3097357 RepID=UPI002A0B9FD9|nr:two-component system activity regulator YycH [Cytobacillus sp. IB215665]MDX8363567.1 two-component system activity regulator YycH [Cytobacillus sp. IB215665]
MKFEVIKSILLTTLILISIILTWNIWTFQNKYKTLENPDINQFVLVNNETRDVEELIKPSQMFIHYNYDDYGTNEYYKIDKMLSEIQKWIITNVTNISNTIPQKDFLSFIHGDSKFEIVYQDQVPAEFTKKMFQFQNPDILVGLYDRIVVDVDKGELYFVLYDKQRVYKASLDNVYLENIRKNFQEKKSYSHYIPYDINEVKRIYVPSGEQAVYQLEYTYETLAPEVFKDALFSDPKSVKKESLYSHVVVYTDGSRFMEINSLTNRLKFENPVSEDSDILSTANTVLKSIDFVNSHGGWTDKYRYWSWDENREKYTQTTEFQLFLRNLPVFNESNLTKIEQYWRNGKLYRYERPMIELKISEHREVTIPTGEEIINHLEQMEQFNKDSLEDLILGYRLRRDERDVLIFDPVWFYRYNNIWRHINVEEVGGEYIGLE